MNSKLASIVFLFAFLVVITVGFLNRDGGSSRRRDPLSGIQLRDADEPVRSPAGSADGVKTPEKKASPSPSPRKDSASAESFDVREAYAMERAPDGRVHSLIRKPGFVSRENSATAGRQPASAFAFRDSRSAISLADAFLSQSRQTLGIDPARPLINPQVSNTAATANIGYRQSVEGVPVLGGGEVNVLVDSSGQVQAVYSNYLAKTEVLNSVRVASQGRRHWLWKETENDATQTALLRHVFESFDHGFQVLTDAETGAEVLRRNRQIQ